MMDERIKELKKMAEYPEPKIGVPSWKLAFKTSLSLVKRNLPTVLYGPPGTAKTRMAQEIKENLAAEGVLGNYEFVQFHQKFSYEDFIEGYKPDVHGAFEKRDGIFKKFCKEAEKTKSKINLFVIDEFNRAELATTLGETLFLLEDRKNRRANTSHFNETFSIPENVAILATMNTADRTITVIDYALRRRFRFVSVFPDYFELRSWLLTLGAKFKNFSVDEYCTMAYVINRRISKHPLMGKNMQLGQTFFVPDVTEDLGESVLVEAFVQSILPQLEAYCGFGREDQMEQIVTPALAKKFLSGVEITEEDIVSLVKSLSTENEAITWRNKK